MTSSRLLQELTQELDVESMAADIQRGIFPSQSFFGDMNISTMFSKFMEGAQTATNYSGATSLKSDLVTSREAGQNFRFTKKEYAEIQKKSTSIAAYGNIPVDVVEDFLLILCYIDKLEDMQVIADAIQIPELDNVKILRDVFSILAVPKLEKIAYMASAVEGLINLFKRYLRAAEITGNNNSGESIMDVIGSMVSGFGGGGGIAATLFEGTTPEELSGNFFSELITGERVPMSVIAKNPLQQAPSYIGRAFFGEAATALSLVDIDQIFNKKLGVFPVPSAGAGTTSFGLQNLGSFSNQMNIQSLVGKMAFGTSNITPGTMKETLINNVGTQLNSILGTTLTENVDITRADTAIPIMQAMSAVFAGSDKSPFSIDTFKNAWMKSNSLSNHLQNTNIPMIEAIKRFA